MLRHASALAPSCCVLASQQRTLSAMCGRICSAGHVQCIFYICKCIYIYLHYLSKRQNQRKTKVVGSRLGMFNCASKSSLTNTLFNIFLHIEWRHRPSRPIGDHPLRPCRLRVRSTFVCRVFGLPWLGCVRGLFLLKQHDFSSRMDTSPFFA